MGGGGGREGAPALAHQTHTHHTGVIGPGPHEVIADAGAGGCLTQDGIGGHCGPRGAQPLWVTARKVVQGVVKDGGNGGQSAGKGGEGLEVEEGAPPSPTSTCTDTTGIDQHSIRIGSRGPWFYQGLVGYGGSPCILGHRAHTPLHHLEAGPRVLWVGGQLLGQQG